jgi:hypothetical protein
MKKQATNEEIITVSNLRGNSLHDSKSEVAK